MIIFREKRELQSEFFPSKICIVMRVGAKTEAVPRFRMELDDFSVIIYNRSLLV